VRRGLFATLLFVGSVREPTHIVPERGQQPADEISEQDFLTNEKAAAATLRPVKSGLPVFP
jgi:hypothetical protein